MLGTVQRLNDHTSEALQCCSHIVLALLASQIISLCLASMLCHHLSLQPPS